MLACPLETKVLSRHFDGRSIVERINLSVAAGELVALHGANGAGKTTLLRCLAGSLRPTSGTVLWCGVSPFRRPEAYRLLGFAGHESFIYPELTVQENLLFAARMYCLADARQRAATWLAAVGLLQRARQPAGRLSKGMRQRLSIARALLHEPRIVVMDEPFAGLDVAGREWLADRLRELRAQGCAVCFSSHDEGHSCRVADRLFELRDGRLWERDRSGKQRTSRVSSAA